MRPADTASDFDRPRKSAQLRTVCKGSIDSGFGTATFSDSPQKTKPSLVHTATLTSGYQYRALLFDSDAAHAEKLIAQVLQPQNLVVEHVRGLEEALVKLQHRIHYFALVIINVSANGPAWHRILQKLQHVCQRANGQTATLFLCVSETRKETDFILRIEQLGARYAYEQ